MVTAVHRFDFRLVINETPNKWKEGYAVIEFNVFDTVLTFFPTVIVSVKGLYSRCEGQPHSLE
jgi:hypothetical protein